MIVNKKTFFFVTFFIQIFFFNKHHVWVLSDLRIRRVPSHSCFKPLQTYFSCTEVTCKQRRNFTDWIYKQRKKKNCIWAWDTGKNLRKEFSLLCTIQSNFNVVGRDNSGVENVEYGLWSSLEFSSCVSPLIKRPTNNNGAVQSPPRAAIKSFHSSYFVCEILSVVSLNSAFRVCYF